MIFSSLSKTSGVKCRIQLKICEKSLETFCSKLIKFEDILEKLFSCKNIRYQGSQSTGKFKKIDWLNIFQNQEFFWKNFSLLKTSLSSVVVNYKIWKTSHDTFCANLIKLRWKMEYFVFFKNRGFLQKIHKNSSQSIYFQFDISSSLLFQNYGFCWPSFNRYVPRLT